MLLPSIWPAIIRRRAHYKAPHQSPASHERFTVDREWTSASIACPSVRNIIGVYHVKDKASSGELRSESLGSLAPSTPKFALATNTHCLAQDTLPRPNSLSQHPSHFSPAALTPRQHSFPHTYTPTFPIAMVDAKKEKPSFDEIIQAGEQTTCAAPSHTPPVADHPRLQRPPEAQA